MTPLGKIKQVSARQNRAAERIGRMDQRPRLVFCHTQISGYVASCWRALAARGECELLILAEQSDTRSHGFGRELLADLNCRMLSPEELANEALVRSIVLEHRPDVVYVAGWGTPAYRSLALCRDLASARFIMGMDTQIKRNWRQPLARLRIGRYVDRMDRVVVIGERAWLFAAIRLKVPERKIRRYLYGFDYDSYASHHEMRQAQAGGWPKRFLYVGRYSPEKGVDVLVEGYRRYRELRSDAWELSCCGKGPTGELINKTAGAKDLGFLQPGQQDPIYTTHGVFIMPSRSEAWGVAIAEADASGMPVICSEACGGIAELVRPYYNALTFPTGDTEGLSRAMQWMHEHYDRLPEMGRRGQALARPFSAAQWAENWSQMLRELMEGK